MFDLRKIKKIDLSKSECLKEGVTYQFTDELTGKKLIAKLIGHYNDDKDEYLVREFRKLILLSGEPEIGTVLFLATALLNDEEKSCYVMEYLEGETLGCYLEKNDSLSQDIAIDIISQIAEGLEKAHHHEIFHSDLHEANIMIDRIGYVKLIDFLWSDFKIQNEKNLAYDLECFNNIVNKILKKILTNENNLLRKICSGAKSFKKLKSNIIFISEVESDLELFSQKSRNIISKLLKDLGEKYNYQSIAVGKNISVPEKLIPPLTEKEQESLAKNTIDKLSDLIRISNIEAILEEQFRKTLLPLKQAGLLTDWKIIQAFNRGALMKGPYDFTYYIAYSSKFFHWKKISMGIDFLEPGNGLSAINLILE
jgi:tRNA A-37 threonylcarbamoyl transferase component Bud32